MCRSNGQAHRTYQLRIRLHGDTEITVGKLGRFCFAAGCYVYTGSARRNLEQRLTRHRRQDKPLRWHIDYLLAAPEAEIVDILTFAEDECVVNQRQAGEIVVRGFGSSDCKNCSAHLKRIQEFWLK